MYKYLTPILLFLLYNFAFGQKETQITFSNNLPDSIQILLDKKDATQEERLDALCKAMDYYALIQEIHNTDQYIAELETITNNLNDTYYKALFNYYNGRYLFQNNSLSAIKCIYESIRQLHLLPNNNRNKKLEIRNYIALSSFYINNDMFLEAYEAIKNGLNINNELKDKEINFKLNLNLALLYLKIGLKEESFNINHQLLEEIKDKGAKVDIYRSYILNNIGIFYMNILDSAIIYYDSAMYFATTPFLNTLLLNNIGIAYAKKQNIKKAEYYFNKSLNITSNNNIIHNYCITLCNIASLKISKQEFDSALIYANKAINIAKKYNFLIYTKDALSIKKEVLGELNNYKKFTEITKELDLISDSINNIQNIESVKKAVLQEQILEKEKEFNDEIKKQDYQNKKEKISLIIIILMLLIIVVILIYIYKLSADKKRVILNNKKIKEEALSKELEFNKKELKLSNKELNLSNKELDLRNKELDLRNRELTSNMLLLSKNNDLLNNAIKELSNLSIKDIINFNEIQPIINNIKQTINNNSYDNFKLSFIKVHPDFFNKLLQDYPDLTQHELKICSFLKINLSTNDIASILNITPEGARSLKSKIKKKLNAQSKTDEPIMYILSKY